MSCALCSVRDRSRRDNEDSGFYLLAATPAMGQLLAGILAEHHVIFERHRDLFLLVSPHGRSPRDYRRIVALLRQVLSEPEREAVGAFTGNGTQFPAPRPLDEWWRVFETGWFDRALTEDRFLTWFQPIVDTASQRVIAHECLIRLCAGRVYSGAEIVDAAMVRNEIHRFDAYARSLAIRSAGGQSRDATYFVNFLPASIYNPDLCLKSTLRALEESGLQPRNFVFEVVESELVRDAAHLRRICDYYRSHGFGFALDDVGTGAHSLQMVCELQPDYVKLDKSLVQNAERPTYAATIRKLVELADRFGVTVIAEGVERTQVMENLWLLGVQCMQGYLFGHPGPRLSTPDADPVNPAHSFGPRRDAACERERIPVLAVN
ncbi:MAG: EAL domain-containing protein [Acidobacteriota bacterium]